MRNSVPPSYTINFNDQIHCFELYQSDLAPNFVCIAVPRKLILGIVRFPEENELELFEWHQLREIYQETRCHGITFAPETSLAVLPKIVTLATTGADFNVRIYRSDLQSSETIQLLKGHSNYINDIAYDTEGDYLATVSDDHSCIIWDSQENFESKITFCLKSAGISLKWHVEEPGKILVAEKNGVIHLYNVKTQQAIMSLESPKIPLMCADWSIQNRLHICALGGGDIISWDLRRACKPNDIKPMHEDCGRIVKFSPHSDHVIASIGRPEITLKVITLKSQIPLIEASLKLFGGLCWHFRLSYIAAAQDRKLCFWNVQAK